VSSLKGRCKTTKRYKWRLKNLNLLVKNRQRNSMVTMAERMTRVETKLDNSLEGQREICKNVGKMDGKLDSYVEAIYAELKMKADKSEVNDLKIIIEKNSRSLLDLSFKVATLGMVVGLVTKQAGLW
jgi:hypothetical protein